MVVSVDYVGMDPISKETHILLRVNFNNSLLYNMPTVIYDSQTTFQTDLNIDNLTEPDVDELDVDANRKDWFNVSDLAIMTIDGDNVTRVTSGAITYQKIKNARATMVKVEGGTALYAGTGGTAVTDYVTITIDPELTESNAFATYTNGVLAGAGKSVTDNAAANIYNRTQAEALTKENDAATMTEIGHTAPYDVILGCYTWECIYTSSHPFVTSTSTALTGVKTTNAINVATFGNLIYNSDSLKNYRQDGYTQILKSVNDIASETVLYAIPKRNAVGDTIIPSTAAGLHDLDWYLTLGTSATDVGMQPNGSPSTTTEIRAKFWYDILIDYAENTSEIEVDRQNLPEADQVHPYVSDGTVIDAANAGTFADPIYNNVIGSVGLRMNMLQKNLETMIVNIYNEDGLRIWKKMTLIGDDYTVGDEAAGTTNTTYDDALINSGTQTIEDLSLTFVAGALTEAVIPIAPTGTVSGGDDVLFRANLDVNFDVGTGAALFSGQENKSIQTFMVGITVDPSDL